MFLTSLAKCSRGPGLVIAETDSAAAWMASAGGADAASAGGAAPARGGGAGGVASQAVVVEVKNLLVHRCSFSDLCCCC